MKRINSLVIAIVLTVLAALAASGQETMMKKVGNAVEGGAKKTISGTKTGWSRGRRIGHTVGTRTWNGTKWVASKSYKGGKWVAVKTVNGTKWVYRKARGTAKRRL